MWFIFRFPARDSRCRICSPEETSRGAVCGAGPGREPVAVGESGHVPDVGEDPGCHHRPDAGQVHQRGSSRLDQRLELLGQRLDLLIHRHQVGELFGREPAAGLTGQVPGTGGGEDRLGLQGR
jgi:hypothetical protein